MTDLTISIVNWNSYELLMECIKSVYGTINTIRFDVIVVDNNSLDRRIENIKNIFPAVKLILNEKNVGYACAHNQVIRKTQSPYILLLNPDCVLFPGTIDTIIHSLESESDIGIAGAKVVSPQGEVFDTVLPFPRLRDDFLFMVQDYFYPFGYILIPFTKGAFKRSVVGEKELEIVYVEESITGPFLLLRRSMLDEIGLLDENFFLFSEENDLCLRARKHGWRRVYFPHQKVCHALGGARKKAPAGFSRYHQTRSKLLFYRKHYGRRCMFPMIVISSLFAGYSLFVGFFKKFFLCCRDKMANESYIVSCKSILKAIYSVIFGKDFYFPGTD